MTEIPNIEGCRLKQISMIPKMVDPTIAKSFKYRKEPFIKGPLSLMWLICAAVLPGKAINVGLALQYWSGILKRRTIKLTSHKCQAFGVILRNGKFLRFGITRPAKLRALRYLEKAGLIKVQWYKSKAPDVTILDIW